MGRGQGTGSVHAVEQRPHQERGLAATGTCSGALASARAQAL